MILLRDLLVFGVVVFLFSLFLFFNNGSFKIFVTKKMCCFYGILYASKAFTKIYRPP